MQTAGRLLCAIVSVGLVTLVAHLLGLELLAETDIVLLYVAAIVVVASSCGRAASFVSAVLSVAAFDVFFVEPVMTFAVYESRHVLTFFMLLATSLFVSAVATRLKEQERSARARERRTASLLALTRVTAEATRPSEVCAALAEHAARVFDRRAAVLLPDERGELCLAASSGGGLASAERAAAREARAPAGGGSDVLTLPLGGGGRGVHGVLVLAGECEADALDDADRELAGAFVAQAAAALHRLRLAEDASTVAVRRRTEEIRTSLLSAVSHDLRTPLGSITGAATTLLADGMQLEEGERRELLEAIADQAFQLERLVTSLLDMSRVEAGALALRREWVPIEELVGTALHRTKDRLLPREVHIELGADVPLLHVDPVLFEQVLVNLLDNAAKHTPPSSRVFINARAAAGGVDVEVVDDGNGLPSDIDVFEKFVRGPSTRARGLGLGLAICKSVISAHGGTLRAAPAAGRGGALMRISLPLPPLPPSPPGDAAPLEAR